MSKVKSHLPNVSSHPARLTAWVGLAAIVITGFGLSAQLIISTPVQELAAACPVLNSGDRFKVSDGNAVYILDSNLRRLYFPHADVYLTWFKDYAGIKEIARSCVDNYPIPDKPPYGINFRPGAQLVKLRISNSVYAILPGNKLAKLESEKVARELYGDNWSKWVKDVNDEFWNNFTGQADPIAEAKPHDGMTVKINGVVYYVKNKKLQQVAGNASSLPGERTINSPTDILPLAGVAMTLGDIMADPSQTRTPVTAPVSTAPTEESQSAANIVPPIISNVRVSNITQTSATISWTTNEPASSSLRYSSQSSDTASAQAFANQSGLNTEHSITLPYLFASTTYYFSISAADQNQNTATADEQNFRTSSPPPVGERVRASQKKWELKTVANDAIYPDSSAALNPAGTVVYIGSRTKLYALNTNGSLAWTYNVNSATAPTVTADGTIYFGSKDKALIALNSNGTEKWKFVASDIIGSPAIDRDGTIYFTDRSPAFYSLNPDGTEKWRMALRDFADGAPVISRGIIYFGTRDGNLYAVRADGSIMWTFKTDGEIATPPAIGKDGTIYTASFDGKLYAINQNGTKKWLNNLGHGVTIKSSPVIGADNTIYLAVAPDLYAINPLDGSIKWTLSNDAHSTPAIGADGTIFVSVSTNRPVPSGSITALDSTGAALWSFDIAGSGNVTPPTIGTDGTIYFGYEQYVYAIGSNSYGLADSPWPKFQKDNQNTGR